MLRAHPRQQVPSATHRVALASAVMLVVPQMYACGEGPLLVLGDREPPGYRFDPPQLVAELSVSAKTDNPTLTADMLEIFFTSERDGESADVFVARRSQRAEPFGEVERLVEVSSAEVETSPAVSKDGLTLWLASDRPGGQGGLDIWVARRGSRTAAWSQPENLLPLNSSGQDIPRPLGQGQRVMPMASDRASAPYYRVLFAERDRPSAPLDAPLAVPELEFPEESTVDAFLTEDGLTLFYVTGPAFGPADMFVAYRRTTAEPFANHRPLAELNTADDERDPWLSPDGHELYFSSDRSGHYDIYVAAVHREESSGQALQRSQ